MKDLIINKNSAVFKIFKKRFHCRVPMHSTISYYEMEKYGVYETVNPEASAYSPVDKFLTIAQLADFHKDGVSIELVSPRDSGEIYELILEHLKMWRDYGLNYGVPYEPPMEDLHSLNELAKVIYSMALTYGEYREKDEDLFDLLEGLMPLHDSELIYDKGHIDIMSEIEALTEKLGEFKRYGH